MAIFVTDGFEQIKLTEPKMVFDEGAETHAVSPKSDPDPQIEVHSQKFRGTSDI